MRRRVLLTAGLLLAGVLLLSGWACARALQVRDVLLEAQGQARAVQALVTDGRVDEAAARLPRLRARLDHAAGLAHGPSWSVATRVPVLGGNLRAVQRAADAGQLLGDDALPPLVHALQVVRRDRPLRDGQVQLAVLRRLQPDVDRAAAGAARAHAVASGHERLLLGTVRRRLDDLARQVGDLDASLTTAAQALRSAPAMLGAEGPRRYFVAVQNNAEARATGGLVGAWALLRADGGRLRLERTGTNLDLRSAASPVPSDPAAAASWRRTGSTVAWFDANLTPHFPDAARNMAGLWRAQGGPPLDGVVALDPVVMAELLRAAGPVRLADGSTVGGDDVVDFVMRREYVDYPDNDVRKALLADLAARVFDRVVAAPEPLPAFRALVRSAGSGHLFLWSARPAEQSLVTRGLAGGALPAEDTPYLQVLTQNYGGNKLDYYLRRAVTVTPAGPGLLRVQVVLRNTAPTGLPWYVTIRSDKPQPPVPYGQARVGFSVYGALSSAISDVRVDGRPAVMAFDRDHGHDLGTMAVEVPRGRPVTVTLLVSEPAGALVYRQQPLVVPDALRVAVPHRVVGR